MRLHCQPAQAILLCATQFQQENELLFDHMSTLVDEVRQIEGKVVEISHLQEIFSEKVLQQVVCAPYVTQVLNCTAMVKIMSFYLNLLPLQSYQLDGIQLMTVTSTDNVKEGNEKIREVSDMCTSCLFACSEIAIVCRLSGTREVFGGGFFSSSLCVPSLSFS